MASAGNQGRAKVVPTAAASVQGNELHVLRQHVDSQVGALRTEVNAVRTEMKAEIATVMATIQTAEAQRTIDFTNLTTSIEATRTSLPTKSEMWKIVGSVVGGGMALLALLWTVFGAGAAATGGFAEQVLERKEAQTAIQKQLSDQSEILKALRDDYTPGSPRTGQAPAVPQGTPERPTGKQ